MENQDKKYKCPICNNNLLLHTGTRFTLKGLENHIIDFHKRVDYLDLIELSAKYANR